MKCGRAHGGIAEFKSASKDGFNRMEDMDEVLVPRSNAVLLSLSIQSGLRYSQMGACRTCARRYFAMRQEQVRDWEYFRERKGALKLEKALLTRRSITLI